MKLCRPYICYIMDLDEILLLILNDKTGKTWDVHIQESDLKSYYAERRIVLYSVYLEWVWRGRELKPIRLVKVLDNFLKSA